ncbi:MAG: chlorite dismutase family protein [Thermodesulfobacteriota bacterium]|nr:MAG: chlorite dismutase family protein [Thermodesulfobacteriota bacterium]
MTENEKPGHPGRHHGGAPGAKPPGGGGIDLEALVDVSEKGGMKDGVRQRLNRRLFVQLNVFTRCKDPKPLIKSIEKAGIEAALYLDIHDPQGVGLVTMSQDPEFFTTALREMLNGPGFGELELRREYSMLGRTYGLGHEEDLEDWLLKRTRRVVLNADWPWAVWYPLRRTGEFARLPKEEQAAMLMEHGVIGRAFGKADLGHDVRLVSNGLDQNDNDFVIGLIGNELHPLSALVQTMRGTRQTSAYIQEMGPFFVGRAAYQSPMKAE